MIAIRKLHKTILKPSLKIGDGEKIPLLVKKKPSKMKTPITTLGMFEDEIKEKIRQFQLSQDTPWKYRKRSDDEKERIRVALTGRKRPDDVIEKLRVPKKNKENYSYKKKKIECPHCGKEAQPALAYRWHFDSCKNKL